MQSELNKQIKSAEEIQAELELSEKAHDITLGQLQEARDERNKWKDLCKRLLGEMDAAEWCSPMQEEARELLSLQSEVRPDGSSDAVDFVEWMVKDMKVERVAGMWEVHGLAHEFEDGKTAICPVRSTAWLYEYYTRKNNQNSNKR